MGIVYDPVGGPLTAHYAGGLARGAIILLYGSLSNQPTVVPINRMIRTASIIKPHSVYNYIDDPALKDEGIRFVSEALAAGRIKPIIDRTYPLEDFRAAYGYQLAAKNRRGKIIVNP